MGQAFWNLANAFEKPSAIQLEYYRDGGRGRNKTAVRIILNFQTFSHYKPRGLSNANMFHQYRLYFLPSSRQKKHVTMNTIMSNGNKS